MKEYTIKKDILSKYILKYLSTKEFSYSFSEYNDSIVLYVLDKDYESLLKTIGEVEYRSKMKYVWLEMPEGQFSNSFTFQDKEILDNQDIEYASKTGFKMIAYTCENDEDFTFYNMMRFK